MVTTKTVTSRAREARPANLKLLGRDRPTTCLLFARRSRRIEASSPLGCASSTRAKGRLGVEDRASRHAIAPPMDPATGSHSVGPGESLAVRVGSFWFSALDWVWTSLPCGPWGPPRTFRSGQLVGKLRSPRNWRTRGGARGQPHESPALLTYDPRAPVKLRTKGAHGFSWRPRAPRRRPNQARTTPIDRQTRRTFRSLL
jgi:hypothetical protein